MVLRVGRSLWACAVLWFACTGGAIADDTQQLSEVVVTAQKVRQTLEQVPASVTSIGGEYIRNSGVRDFQELSDYTANTNLQVSSSSTQLLVRGFGTLNDVPGLDPSVGVVVDGVVYTYPEYLTAFFGDLDRYEVLRGPQGTLFGKNVTAGILNITTNAPDPRETLIRVDTDWRSYGSRAYRPVVNLPLGYGFSLRATGNFEHGDRGAFWNTDLNRAEGNPQQDSGRVRLRYDSHNGWTMDLGLFAAYHEENFNKQQLFIVGPNMQALARSYDPRFDTLINGTVSEDVPATENATTRGASVTFDGDLGTPYGMKSLHLVSITGIAQNVIGSRDIDADFGPVPFIHDGLAGPEPERQFTQELRVTAIAPDVFGFGHDATFVAGLYYDNYTLRTSDLFQIENLGGAAGYILAADCDQNGVSASACAPALTTPVLPCLSLPLVGSLLQGLCGQHAGAPGVTVGDLINAIAQPLLGPQQAVSGVALRTKDYAAFGNVEWYFTERWALLLGLRYGKENRRGEPHSYSSSALIQAIADQQNFDDTGSNALHRTESDFSPKAGLKYQPSKHSEAYFSWSDGFKSGGFNGIPLNPNQIEFDAEKASSFEAGYKIKDRLFGGPIRGSFSVYRTHFSNLQVSTFQGTNVVIVNGPGARSQGFEADLQWLLPIKGLSLYSSFGFADARYTNYYYGITTGDNHCPSADRKHTTGSGSSQTVYCNLSGEPLAFAPQWSAAMTPAYTFLHLPYSIDVTAAVDVLFQGQRYLNSEDDPRELQKATLMINPHLVVADQASGDWGLSMGIQNLTNEISSDQIIDEPLAPGNFAANRHDRGRFYTGSLFINFH
jgi:outer membrane receptor protein involved in Fe transport